MATIYNNDIEKLIPRSTKDNEGLELITCKRQPGNLRITKYACALRYEKSLRMEDEIPDDEFGMIIKHGLERCRDCPRGKRYAEVLRQPQAARKRRGRPPKASQIAAQQKALRSRKKQVRKNDVVNGRQL
ncbi:MAG: hypothetical protein JRI51_11245 [Deltaproteobacteria bacterium]|nr:hypothetical protein [Deltaproteobacteria bacterium]